MSDIEPAIDGAEEIEPDMDGAEEIEPAMDGADDTETIIGEAEDIVDKPMELVRLNTPKSADVSLRETGLDDVVISDEFFIFVV